MSASLHFLSLGRSGANMAVNMVSLSVSAFRVRVEGEERSAVGASVGRSIRSLKGRTTLRPSFCEGVATLKKCGGLLALSRRTEANSRRAFVCSAVASGGQSESESEPEAPKPNQSLNVFLRLVHFSFALEFISGVCRMGDVLFVCEF